MTRFICFGCSALLLVATARVVSLLSVSNALCKLQLHMYFTYLRCLVHISLYAHLNLLMFTFTAASTLFSCLGMLLAMFYVHALLYVRVDVCFTVTVIITVMFINFTCICVCEFYFVYCYTFTLCDTCMS